jgi:excinuclease ABC subunit B
MRAAAADLEFEEAARLRDEVKRLKAVELAVMDDPLARDPTAAPDRRSRVKGPESAWPQPKPPGRRPGSSGGKPGSRTFRKKGK